MVSCVVSYVVSYVAPDTEYVIRARKYFTMNGSDDYKDRFIELSVIKLFLILIYEIMNDLLVVRGLTVIK